MLIRTSVLAIDQAVRVRFSIGDGLELSLDDRRLGLRQDDRRIRLRLTGETLPEELRRVHVRGQVGAADIETMFEPEPNLYFEHTWDGSSPEPDVPGSPASLLAKLDVGWEMVGRFPRPNRTRWWNRNVTCGGVDLRSLGCGGITPTSVHKLDVTADILWRGDGSRMADARKQSSRAADRLKVRSDELAVSDGPLVHVFDREGTFNRSLSLLKGHVVASLRTDDEGRITSWIDKGNRYTIDRRNDTEAMFRSPAGVWAVMDFDEHGRVVAVTDQAGTKATIEWADAGGLSGITDSAGLITKIERDELGRVVRFLESTGRQLDLVRTEVASGVQVSVTTAEGRETHYRNQHMLDGTTIHTQSCCGAANPRIVEQRSLGPLGDEQVVRHPDGTIATTRQGSQADNEGLIEIARTSITSPTGRTLSIERKTDYHRSGVTSDQMTVGKAMWKKRTEPVSHTTTTTTPEGRETVAQLIPGKKLTVTTPAAGLLGIEYDDVSRPRKQRHNGSEVTFGYDPNGRLTWIDFERWRQQIHHDEPGRVVSIETPDGWLQFARDSAGAVESVKATNGAITSIDRRPDGAIEAIHHPEVNGDKLVERFVYDRDGLLVGHAREDDEIRYKRDSMGRVSGIEARGIDNNISYDRSTGHLIEMKTNEGDVVSYQHDGDMEWAEFAAGRTSGRIERHFDDDHRIVTRTVNGSHEVHYGRDKDGILKSLGPLQIEHNKAGLAVELRLGGLTTSREYDSDGRLTSHSTRFGKLRRVYFAQTIERDSLGRIIEINEHVQGVNRTITYEYNDQRRLAGVEIDGEQSLTVGYDDNGNIIELDRRGKTLSISVDKRDRLTAFAGAATEHDSAGNLAAIGTDPALRSYRFDGMSRLIGFSDARGVRIRHVLDALGRPIETSSSEDPPLRMLWDGDRLAATLSGDNDVDIRFIDSGAGPAPEALIRDGVPYLIVTDHLGSVRCVVDAQEGDVVQALDFDALGNNTRDTAPGWQPFGFAGGLHDPKSGLVRFMARTYDPFVGRFLSPDPLGFAGGQINLYQYAHGDPINYSDPSGLLSVSHGEVDVCGATFIGARPLTMDWVYLKTDEWRSSMTPLNSLGTVGRLLMRWTNAPGHGKSATAKLADFETDCGGSPDHLWTDIAAYSVDGNASDGSVWNVLDSCLDPSAWEYDESSWSRDPGFLETVGRVMQLAVTTKKWVPKLNTSLARLTDSL